MYELLDTVAAIKEIQKFLYVISDRVNNEIPRVSIDGFYGEETENSVRIFQEIYDIEPSGKVDLITFNLLYSLYDENRIESNSKTIQNEYFPIALGDQGNHVLNLHIVMLELKKRYKDIGNITKTTYFSKESENATWELQKIFRHLENGIVDYNLYIRMLTELDSLKR